MGARERMGWVGIVCLWVLGVPMGWVGTRLGCGGLWGCGGCEVWGVGHWGAPLGAETPLGWVGTRVHPWVPGTHLGLVGIGYLWVLGSL